MSMESDSLPDILRILAYMAVVFAAIVGPMIFLREKRRQGPPRGPRHTDPVSPPRPR
jgi:hypothetical protein